MEWYLYKVISFLDLFSRLQSSDIQKALIQITIFRFKLSVKRLGLLLEFEAGLRVRVTTPQKKCTRWHTFLVVVVCNLYVGDSTAAT